MPFLQEAGSVEVGLIGGRVGSGLTAARLIVDPDKVMALKRGIEEEQRRVREWLLANKNRLSSVREPGTDPCSEESVRALGENGKAALVAAEGYVAQLKNVADALSEIARAYGLTEEENTQRFPWEPE